MKQINVLINLVKTDWRAQLAAILIAGIIVYIIIKKAKSMSIDQRIRATAKSEGMPANMQALIVAQAKHETGNFTSNAYRNNNNLFGYKYVKNGYLQIAAGITSSEGNAYAAYASIEDSVRVVCFWIRKRQSEGKFPADLSGLTAASYAQYLKSAGYYGDTVANYTKGLQKFLA